MAQRTALRVRAVRSKTVEVTGSSCQPCAREIATDEIRLGEEKKSRVQQYKSMHVSALTGSA